MQLHAKLNILTLQYVLISMMQLQRRLMHQLQW